MLLVLVACSLSKNEYPCFKRINHLISNPEAKVKIAFFASAFKIMYVIIRSLVTMVNIISIIRSKILYKRCLFIGIACHPLFFKFLGEPCKATLRSTTLSYAWNKARDQGPALEKQNFLDLWSSIFFFPLWTPTSPCTLSAYKTSQLIFWIFYNHVNIQC